MGLLVLVSKVTLKNRNIIDFSSQWNVLLYKTLILIEERNLKFSILLKRTFMVL